MNSKLRMASEMAGYVTDTPLQLRVEFPNGNRTLDFADVPQSRLARQLVHTLLTMCNTGGGIKRKKTIGAYATAARRYLEWMDRQGFVGGVADLRPEHVSGYLRSGEAQYDRQFKELIRRTCEEFADVVSADVVAHAQARTPEQMTRYAPLLPYSEGESQRLIAACKQAIAETESRLAAGRELLAQGRCPESPEDWKFYPNLLWLVDYHGPYASREEIAIAEGRPPGTLGSLNSRADAGTRSVKELRGRLWPDPVDLIPYLLLLGLNTGLSPEGVTSLRVDGVEMLGEGKVRVRWFKARGGGLEADTFSSRGQWSPGALIDRAIAVTAPLRAVYHDPNALWLAATNKTTVVSLDDNDHMGRDLASLVSAWKLLDDQGELLRLNRKRLRKTYYARLDKRYHGAVNIIAGTNQTAQVAADHYLAATAETSQMREAVEQTQQMLLARAEASRRVMVLSEQQVEELAADPAAAAAVLALPMFQAEQVLTTTESDVFAAKCKDFHNSPHGKPGEPCPAAVWECLFCPLAVITPTKLPNLLRLLDHIDAQAQELELGEWQRRYLASRRAIKDQILPQFAQEVIDAAQTQAGTAPLYLPPEEMFG